MSEGFIGVDVGTRDARAGVFDDKGLLVASARRPIAIWRDPGAIVEQSSGDIWRAVVEKGPRLLDPPLDQVLEAVHDPQDVPPGVPGLDGGSRDDRVHPRGGAAAAQDSQPHVPVVPATRRSRQADGPQTRPGGTLGLVTVQFLRPRRYRAVTAAVRAGRFRYVWPMPKSNCIGRFRGTPELTSARRVLPG